MLVWSSNTKNSVLVALLVQVVFDKRRNNKMRKCNIPCFVYDQKSGFWIKVEKIITGHSEFLYCIKRLYKTVNILLSLFWFGTLEGIEYIVKHTVIVYLKWWYVLKFTYMFIFFLVTLNRLSLRSQVTSTSINVFVYVNLYVFFTHFLRTL